MYQVSERVKKQFEYTMSIPCVKEAMKFIQDDERNTIEEQKELEGKIESKKVQLEKAKATLDLIPAQHGYQNALEVTKAMKLAKAELKKAQQAQKEWDAQELKQEKLYLTIPANVSNMRVRDVQKSTGQKRSIHERLEEKKQIVEQQTKRKQRSGMEL